MVTGASVVQWLWPFDRDRVQVSVAVTDQFKARMYDMLHLDGITWSFDLMGDQGVPRQDRAANVLEYRMPPLYTGPDASLCNPPKYPDPEAQIDTTNVIQPGDNTYCPDAY